MTFVKNEFTKYKMIDGKWHKSQCLDCGVWRLSHIPGKCHTCTWKNKRNPVIAHGVPIKHYHKAHYHIAKNYGKPTTCEKCGLHDKNTRRFHWANLSGEYNLDRSDWLRLCASCHKLMDNNRKEVKV